VRPQLLFLDEPTASLDPSAKRDVEGLIEEFAGEGMTVIMSTHNLGQAKRLASRVLYLEDGQLVVDRSVQAFFNEPLPEAAAQFLSGERA
jgi:tungstate transport system ATP-binding protein